MESVQILHEGLNVGASIADKGTQFYGTDLWGTTSGVISDPTLGDPQACGYFTSIQKPFLGELRRRECDCVWD
jgi:hypothetical protein